MKAAFARCFFFLLSLAAVFDGAVAQLTASDLPTLSGSIPPASFPALQVPAPIDLRNYFAVTSITGTVVQFTTPGVGVFNVEMNATAAPNTVANFLSYVNAGSYTDSIVHRSDQQLGVIQGGGYFLFGSNVFTIAANAPINLETTDTLLNVRGTISMARTSFPNSATTQWFINTVDNSQILPSANGGGYAVFGRITGTGMDVVDGIATRPVLGGFVTVTSSSTSNASVTISSAPASFGPGWSLLGSLVVSRNGNLVVLNANANQTIDGTSGPVTFATSRFASPFDQLPVLQTLPPDGSVALTNLITNHSIRVVPIFPAVANGPAVVTFTASSSNPVITATISGSNLNLAATANVDATANVTVTATDTNGNFVQTTFAVTTTFQPPVQAWRQNWYHTTVNSGDAANDADPYHRGIPNLAAFALIGPAQDPSTASLAQAPQVQVSGGNFFYRFTEPAGVGGVRYAAQWTADLAAPNWQPVSDTGSGTEHIFSVPTGANPQIFLRLLVTEL